MATVYPTSAGAWSTRTWNDDATGLPYGMLPQPGDTVLANGLVISINMNITVESVRTRPGAFAVAGGTFNTIGAWTVNADSYAGSSSCLILAQGTNAIQNGNSYGSDSSNNINGTIVERGCIQYGNSYGGNGANRRGTLINAGGLQVGNAYGGSGSVDAIGTQIQTCGRLVGDVWGGSSGAIGRGCVINNQGACLIGNCYGRTGEGVSVSSAGSCIIGNAIGSSVAGETAVAVNLSGNGGLFIGDAIGGTVGRGIFCNGFGAAIIRNATRLGTPWAAEFATNINYCIVDNGSSNTSRGPLTVQTYEGLYLNYPYLNPAFLGSSGIPIGRLISGGV